MTRIGVDIGGMSIKVGLVNDQGKILGKNVVKTASTYLQTIDNLVKQINDLLNDNGLKISDISGIGIGSPGLVMSKKGIIRSACNLGWDEVHICEDLSRFFDTKIRISNDANVATLAETKYGSVKNVDSAIMLTLGTGVGGGIVADGKLFEGGDSLGAELGHVVLNQEGIDCTCGKRGCVEQYVSASALMRDTKIAMQNDKNSKMWDYVGGDINKVDGKCAFESSKLGDKSAKLVVDNFCRYLGNTIMSFDNIFRPELFIIGGGVSAQKDYLIDKVLDYLKPFYIDSPFSLRLPKIVTAELGNDAGIIGAAELLNL
ncbi:MAG: ROK family protein [Clostridia bacterium]|nr:ROK family protein [Clostridia bacterium]